MPSGKRTAAAYCIVLLILTARTLILLASVGTYIDDTAAAADDAVTQFALQQRRRGADGHDHRGGGGLRRSVPPPKKLGQEVQVQVEHVPGVDVPVPVDLVNSSIFFTHTDWNEGFLLPRVDPMFANWTARRGHHVWLLDDSSDNDHPTSTSTGGASRSSIMLPRPAPALILLTTNGWNSLNNSRFSRSVRGLELLRGVVTHPWFHPSALEDIESGRMTIDPSLRYYIFPDMDTCIEKNYPYYGEDQLNKDVAGGRVAQTRGKSVPSCDRLPPKDCPSISRLRTNSKTSVLGAASRSYHNVMAMYINCQGFGPKLSGADIVRDEFPFAIAASSAYARSLNPLVDQGMPPPAVTPIELTREQERDIETCDESKRDIFVSFVGNIGRGRVRQQLYDVLHGRQSEGIWFVPRSEIRVTVEKSYYEIMEQSVFALTPAGDNPFSYRFPEALSAGAIPVVHADGWVWPFRSELVDWTKCAVPIPEKDYNKTLDILRSIDAKTRCEMRKYCYRLWQRYHKTAGDSVSGIIEGMELVAQAKHNGGKFPDLANENEHRRHEIGGNASSWGYFALAEN